MTSETSLSWGLEREGGASWIGGTMRSRVANELRNRILMAVLPPGSRLDLDELAEEMGTSRTPIREACLELAHDNLLKMAPRSGVVVLGITERDLLDNFALMASLSGLAASWAALRMSDEDLTEVAVLRDAMEGADGTGRQFAAKNWAFHRKINLCSQSPRLLTMLGNAGRYFPAQFFDSVPEQVPCSVQDHADIVRALEARDAPTVRRVVEGHFDQARELLAKHLGIPVEPGVHE